MREGLFIKKNIEKWKQYQYKSSTDPDEMAREFTELVNDLGYAKTFYPHSKVTQYLNGLASRIYLGIYKNKKEEPAPIHESQENTKINSIIEIIFQDFNDYKLKKNKIGGKYLFIYFY